MYLPTPQKDPADIMMLRSKMIRIMEKLEKLEKETTTCYHQQQQPPPPPIGYYQPPTIGLEYPTAYYPQYQPQPPAVGYYQQQPPVGYLQQYEHQPRENPINWREFMKENSIQPPLYLDQKEIPEVEPISVVVSKPAVVVPKPEPDVVPEPTPVDPKPASVDPEPASVDPVPKPVPVDPVPKPVPVVPASIFQPNSQHPPPELPTFPTLEPKIDDVQPPLPQQIIEINSDSDLTDSSYPSNKFPNLFGRNEFDELLEEDKEAQKILQQDQEYAKKEAEKGPLVLPRNVKIGQLSQKQNDHWTKYTSNDLNKYYFTKSALEYSLVNYTIMKDIPYTRTRKSNGGGMKFTIDFDQETLNKACQYDLEIDNGYDDDDDEND